MFLKVAAIIAVMQLLCKGREQTKVDLGNKIVVFGDDLSDDGINLPDDGYGHFRYSDGWIWSDYLKDALRIPILNMAYTNATIGLESNCKECPDKSEYIGSVSWQIKKFMDSGESLKDYTAIYQIVGFHDCMRVYNIWKKINPIGKKNKTDGETTYLENTQMKPMLALHKANILKLVSRLKSVVVLGFVKLDRFPGYKKMGDQVNNHYGNKLVDDLRLYVDYHITKLPNVVNKPAMFRLDSKVSDLIQDTRFEKHIREMELEKVRGLKTLFPVFYNGAHFGTGIHKQIAELLIKETIRMDFK